MKQDKSNIIPELKSNKEVKTFTITIILPMYNTECLTKNINYNISPKTTKLPISILCFYYLNLINSELLVFKILIIQIALKDQKFLLSLKVSLK